MTPQSEDPTDPLVLAVELSGVSVGIHHLLENEIIKRPVIANVWVLGGDRVQIARAAQEVLIVYIDRRIESED
jgi:hypothetical protein